MKHTPGPWGKVRCLASGRKRFHRIHNDSDMTIASLPIVVDSRYGPLDLESWANAHLIATAPDLLKGLKAMVVIASMYPEIYKQHQKEIEYYHILLDKAQGI